jgi:predicted GIY-YIG superfamily endonuclease
MNQTDEETYLYRHYDAEGRLLYVGISNHLFVRTAKHRNSAPWFREVRRIDVLLYNSREEALDAESAAIKDENPQHNKLRAKRKKPTEELALPPERYYDSSNSYTPAELAAMTRLSVGTLKAWRERNYGPRYARQGNRNGSIVYPCATVSAWLDSIRVDPNV